MGWVRISDDFYDNDKLGEVGPLGMAMHFAAMGFCNRNLTDGFFRKSKARLLLDFAGIGITTASAQFCSISVDGDEAALLVTEWMVAVDLWHEKGHDCDECHARADGGEPTDREYLIHDYLKFQPSRAEIEAKAEATKKRVQAWREARKSGNADCNAVTNGVTNSVRTRVVTHDVHDTPNPNPNPSTSLIETSGGRVTQVDARDAKTPRPHCPQHADNYEGPCRKCKARREWDDTNAAQTQAAELDRRRAIKAARETCPVCDPNGMIETPHGMTRCTQHNEKVST